MEAYVFPLEGVVLYPTATLPLNIFEPRYVQMVNDALESGIPIALCQESPLEPQRGFSREIVAGFGRPIVLKRREDRSMVIVLEGKGKARVGRPLQDEPYIMCELEPIEETSEVEPANLFALNRMRKLLNGWIERSFTDPVLRDRLLCTVGTPQRVVELTATCLIRRPEQQQRILELDDINERIRYMVGLL